MKAGNSRLRGRQIFLGCGLLLIAISAGPAWKRFRTYTTLETARQSLRRGDVAGAIKTLDAFPDDSPYRGEVSYLLGVAHRRSGKSDEAFRYLQQAEDSGWRLDEITRQRYLTRFQAGDIAGTTPYLQQLIVDGAPDDIAEEVYETLAKGFLAEFRVNDAAVVLDHWIAWRPDAIQPRIWRAQLYEQEEGWKGAAEQYRRVVELDPSHLSARVHLGDALFANHQLEEARAEFLEAKRRFPRDVRASLGLAQCDRRLGNGANAAELLRQLVAPTVENEIRALAFSELGQIAMEAGDYTQAGKDFEQAIAIDPNFAQAHHLLGTVCSRHGKPDQAKFHFEKSQAILDRHRKLEELSTEVAQHPSNVDARYELAMLLHELGQDEKSARWLLTVIHLAPNHQQARAALASFFEARGNHELAAAHRQVADLSRDLTAPTPNTPGK